MSIRAVVEYCARGCIVFAQDYPGAFARGKMTGEALAKLPTVVRTYCLWAGIIPPRNTDVAITQTVENDIAIQDADTTLKCFSIRKPCRFLLPNMSV